MMNTLEKKSFYSFLSLYLFSSLVFVLLGGYWYYSAQKNSLESETYYKLEHFADKLSGNIIKAHMMGTKLLLPKSEVFSYKLIKRELSKSYEVGYFQQDGEKVLISNSPREHLNISYVVVKTDSYFIKLYELQKTVITIMSIAFILMVIIAFYLSKIFMRPLHTRVLQIEKFIQDVSHELNTPITALGMGASRALKKGVYDKKILTNISISTKQLESIYKSLAYLNFHQTEEKVEKIELSSMVQRVVNYYSELSSAKKIKVNCDLTNVTLLMVESRAELLISNLVSNAIKYSMPETTIRVLLTQNMLSIKDEGIGISTEKLEEIFELYERSSSIAGGFGIGLSIVKKIADEYKIEIEVKSELEKGSEFILHFKNL